MELRAILGKEFEGIVIEFQNRGIIFEGQFKIMTSMFCKKYSTEFCKLLEYEVADYMGKVMRQYNEFYIKLQKEFKLAHNMTIEAMPAKFSNKDYVKKFTYMFPDKISRLLIERNYWYGKRIIKKI